MAGPGELGNLLKQAQKMQREMDLAREEILEMSIEGAAGGGGPGRARSCCCSCGAAAPGAALPCMVAY